MKPGGSKKKVANSLLAAGSAAVLAVYAAGYVRTRPFADAFDKEAAERRPAVPSTPRRIAPQPVAQRRITPAAQPKAHAPAAPAIPSAPNPVDYAISQAPAPSRTDAPPSLPPATVISQPASPAPPPTGGPTPQVATTAPVPVPVFAPHPTITPPAPSAPTVSAPPAPPRWKDGVYFGWGYSRHGDILSRVEIEDGRIVSATISECKTRYSCSDIDALPPQVIERQRADVDSVSGATESADAFYQGVFEALNQAK